MKSNVKIKKDANKVRNRLKVQQKNSLKVIVYYSFCSTLVVIIMISIFNISNILNSKAGEIEIIQLEEQVFTDEMSLPGPQISSQKKAGPNTVFIQTIKHSDDFSEKKNE